MPTVKKQGLKFLAKTFHGLEEILAKELRELGAENVQVQKRAVSFEGDKELMYRANLHSRTALRILQPVFHFTARNEIELFNQAFKLDWEKFMTVDSTFAIDCVSFGEIFTHSKYVALKVKDAVCDSFRRKTDRRPDVDVYDPDVRFSIHVVRDSITVALDSSGHSLHKRGYREKGFKAPLSEVLAAGMLYISEWTPDIPLLDPMCGSGTILIEAAMMAKNVPAAWFNRNFGFMKWADFDKELWDNIVDEAEQNIKPRDVKILGSDISGNAVNRAKMSSLDTDLNRMIDLKVIAFEDLNPPFGREKGMIIVNPPYDERLKVDDIDDLYATIGNYFKHSYSGYTGWILSSNMEAIKSIGLRPSKKHTLFNGKLECKFLKFEMYEGSKKAKKQYIRTTSIHDVTIDQRNHDANEDAEESTLTKKQIVKSIIAKDTPFRGATPEHKEYKSKEELNAEKIEEPNVVVQEESPIVQEEQIEKSNVKPDEAPIEEKVQAENIDIQQEVAPIEEDAQPEMIDAKSDVGQIEEEAQLEKIDMETDEAPIEKKAQPEKIDAEPDIVPIEEKAQLEKIDIEPVEAPTLEEDNDSGEDDFPKESELKIKFRRIDDADD